MKLAFLLASILTVGTVFAQDYYSDDSFSGFHIDHDTEKGGNDFNLISATFNPVFIDGTKGGVQVCTKETHWLKCSIPNNSDIISASVSVIFVDDKGDAQSCSFTLDKANQMRGTICTDNTRFGAYENGSHSDTINIGYSTRDFR